MPLTDEKQVGRTLRRLGTAEARLQSAYEQRDATTAPQEVRQLVQLVGQLADKIREACRLAYKYVWPILLMGRRPPNATVQIPGERL